jgi:UDP-2,4-diacetamido-2,4,6-trideoxy-beta-L-altropyranose hydrolase
MSAPPSITLRAARDDDADRLFAWRNDAGAVRWSVTGRPVARDSHARWFAARRTDPHVLLWIAEERGNPVAQVRVDITATVGAVSVAVAAAHRGRGIGAEVLRAMVIEVARDGRVRTLRALVHPENAGSIRAFEKVGFHLCAESDRGFRVLELASAAGSTDEMISRSVG